MLKQRNINFTLSQQSIWNIFFLLLVLSYLTIKLRLFKTSQSPKKSRIFNYFYVLLTFIASSSSITYVVATTSLEWHLQFAYFSKALSWLSSSGDLQENLIRSPRCIAPLFILLHHGPCYNNIYWPLCSYFYLMFYY